MKADKGKGARRLGDLLRDLMKRDNLPDIDKVLEALDRSFAY